MTRAPTTLLETLVGQLRACRGRSDGEAEPAAILWTDPEGHWKPLRPLLRAALPELLELGEYAPEERRGPAIWLRCVVDRALAEPALPEDATPILYLPGVGRQDLRAGEETPPSLRPLVELMYRGALYLQKGGHDWTATAFLASPQGLRLDLARDQETTKALLRALPELAQTPLQSLKGRLDAGDFDRLLTADPVRDLLRWMGAPKETRERMGEKAFEAFRNQCKQRFELDPGVDDPITAGASLGSAEGGWSEPWARFEEAPQAFPGISELLRHSKPPSKLVFEKARWPDENERAEEALRGALADLEGLPHVEACDAVLALEKDHGERRRWVWARLGAAPWASVLEPLSELARAARTTLGGSTPDEIARTYDETGWIADAAAWRALALASVREEELVGEVVQTLLEPWLEESAQVFQRAVAGRPLPSHGEAELVSAEEGGCVLFVDGLRYDLGRVLAQRLEGRGLRVRAGRRWAALPTVTATAKPAVTPVADAIGGAEMPADFCPRGVDGRPTNAPWQRAQIERRGYQILGGELGDWPRDDQARGWLEDGEIDSLGHKLGAKLAQQIEPELERLAVRIGALLEGGWRSVRIVTDHGWLLLPEGLPRVDLPKHLTESRWSRCAAIAGRSQVPVPTFPWHWNTAQRFAAAPGIGCFNAETAYAHGGVSIQECLVPDLLVERSGPRAAHVTIASLRWQGMRCFVRVDGADAGLRVELRLERASGKAISNAKPIEARGETNLLVLDDAYEESELVLVLLDPDGTILAQRKTKVGTSS